MILLFVLALCGIILSIHFTATVVLYFLGKQYLTSCVFWNPGVFFWVVVSTLTTVAIGSLYMRNCLDKGGTAVAMMLGGDLILETPADPAERRLLNIVEEMAIASGVGVPFVFVLNKQDRINAFAAGYSPADATIAVTKGAVQLLNRDELQGVVAHEFSHILNGDTRLSLHMTSVLHGLLLISTIGAFILRRGRYIRAGAWGFALLFMGASLFVIGYLGVFFGKLIKRALSRQREYLADASAVQFTRNPDGIAGALKKIGGLFQGSIVPHPYTETMSHIFFENALKQPIFDFLATHPPLDQRIRTIQPSFDGRFPKVNPLPPEKEIIFKKKPTHRIPVVQALQDSDVIRRVANPTPADVAFAGAFLSSLPPEIDKNAREPIGAMATIYATLLSRDPQEQKKQMAYLFTAVGQTEYEEVIRVCPKVRGLGEEGRLPLVDLCIPALRRLSAKQKNAFMIHVRFLAHSDQKLTLFEFALEKILEKYLAGPKQAGKSKTQYFALRPLLPDCEIVLSMLAYAGHKTLAEAKGAFSQVGHRLTRGPFGMLPLEECKIDALEQSLQKLSESVPNIKRRVMEAAAICVAADGKVNVKEAELLRATAAVLECPLPPLLNPASSSAR